MIPSRWALLQSDWGPLGTFGHGDRHTGKMLSGSSGRGQPPAAEERGLARASVTPFEKQVLPTPCPWASSREVCVCCLSAACGPGGRPRKPRCARPQSRCAACRRPPCSLPQKCFPRTPQSPWGLCPLPASCPRLSVQNVPVVPGAGPGPPPRPPEERPLCLPRHRSPLAGGPLLSLAVPASRAVHGGHSSTAPPGALLGRADRLEA